MQGGARERVRRDTGRGKCVVPALFRAGVYESVRTTSDDGSTDGYGVYQRLREQQQFRILGARTMRSSSREGHRVFIYCVRWTLVAVFFYSCFVHLRVFLPSPTGWYDTKRFGSSVIIIITVIIIIIAVGNYGVFFSLVYLIC